MLLCFPILATPQHFDDYRKVAKTDPQVVIDLLKTTEPATQSLSEAEAALLLSSAYYALSQAQPALQQAEKALADSQLQQQSPLRYRQLLLARAMAYDIAGTPAKGLADVSAVLHWAESAQNTELIIEALYSRGALYISLVNYVEALRDLNRAYQLAGQHPELEIHPADIAGMIALVYEYRREDSLAIPYFTEAADYQRAQQNWFELSIALYGLGRAVKNTGDLVRGLSLLNESATLARQLDDWQGVAYAEKEIAGIEHANGNPALARQMFLSALQLFSQGENPYMQLDVNLSLARLALQQQDAATAAQHLQQAERFLDVKSMTIHALEIEKSRIELLALQGDYASAYQQLLSWQNRKQQLEAKQSSEQLHQLRVKYDVEAQQAENALLQQKNAMQSQAFSAQRQQKLLLLLLLVLSLAVLGLMLALVLKARKNKRHLELLADTDGLTGVYNRRKIMQLFQQQFEQAQRYDQSISVAILDLDWFKQINDQFGHQTGDEVLWRFAALCRQQLRKSDLIGRIGGEEFMVIFPCTDQQAATQLAGRLCQKTRELEQVMAVPGLMISVSIGIASHNQFISGAEFIAAADKALYQAKQAGRDQVKLAEPPVAVHLPLH